MDDKACIRLLEQRIAQLEAVIAAFASAETDASESFTDAHLNPRLISETRSSRKR